ncbi:hypothetical protein HHL16_17900 [Pseudoflavitalea sp. G-6-1-2]|uniref:hypothetical protein n=1 Tax=Pseudoflavitalea sp. G-6-1-2 TaxID=2728841 RepID=UPI00146F3FBC|nr:hypothetical protein [Pseudoflavitalea sp. G-6-1-2]NML22763.1 hypothetical protein [Pseudoflavitalea sp. G-6-1-2]
MNQVFDFSRFRLLAARHWIENRQRYLLSLGAFAGLLILWFIFAFLLQGSHEAQNLYVQLGTFYFGLFVTGSLYASTLFSSLAAKPTAINYLSVPASHLEKMLIALLYGVVLFFLTYLVIFYVVDFLMLQILNPIAARNYHPYDVGNKLSEFEPQTLVNVFRPFRENRYDNQNFYYLLMVYFTLQSTFLAGSVFFTRFSFIKTVITLLVFSFLVFVLVFILVEVVIPKGGFSGAGLVKYQLGYESGVITLPESMFTVFRYIGLYAFAPAFWVASYFKLKEKEV